ncbi:hypothetical protein GCM10009663_71620 [Kitasatospora arboriphila]|uniref:Uncharacterized protein n=1 Tax=Kitasatospora arboriphila TaxID=258052 RepID=A0ABP4ENU3_9ACTN
MTTWPGPCGRRPATGADPGDDEGRGDPRGGTAHAVPFRLARIPAPLLSLPLCPGRRRYLSVAEVRPAWTWRWKER